METEKMIFWRNFLLKTFIIGLAFVAFYLITSLIFFNSPMMAWIEGVFKVNENEIGKMTLSFFGAIRFVLVFLILVPCIALHWMIKNKK